DLDPKLPAGVFEFARCSALRGRWDDYRWAVDLMRKNVAARSPVAMLQIRVAAWRGQTEEIEVLADELRGEPGPFAAHVLGYARTAITGVVQGAEETRTLLAQRLNPRF